MDVTVVVDGKNLLGEGPLWDPAAQRLYWFDIKNQKLFRLAPESGALESFDLPIVATAASPTSQEDLILACVGGFHRFDLTTQSVTKIADFEADKPGNRPNDGKVDPQGRFWIGSMENAEENVTGALYSFTGEGVLTQHLDGIGITNTFAWSPDGAWFYHADSMAQTIWRFPWDGASGTLGEREVFVSLKGTDRFPDGSCIDAEGYLWNAQWNGWRVVRYAPDGREDRVIEMPIACPTSCMFGGADLDTLYITSARKGQSDEALAQQPHAGALFALKPGVTGMAEVPWAG